MASIGLLASVAGLATTAFDVSRTIFDLVQTFKGLPQALQDLAHSTSTLGQLLEQTDRKGQTATLETLFGRALRDRSFREVVAGCDRDLGRLRIVLYKLTKDDSSSFLIRVRYTFKWKYLETQVESVKKSLEAHKSLLNILLYLSIEDKVSNVPEIHEDTGRILQLLQVVLDRTASVEEEAQSTLRQTERQLADISSNTEVDLGISMTPTIVDSTGAGLEASRRIVEVETPSIVQSKGAGSEPLPRSSTCAPETIQEPQSNSGSFSPQQEMDRLDQETQSMIVDQPPTRIQTPELVKALVTASRFGFAETAGLLLDTGVDVNAHDEYTTALCEAAYWNHPSVAKLLLERSADPNLANKNGRLPLVLAAMRGYAAMVHLLLQHGADAKLPGILVESVLGLDAEITSALCEAGANVNDVSGDSTPLVQVIYWGKMDAFKVLMKHGVDPALQGNAFASPVVAAAQRDQTEMLNLLLEYGRRRR